MRNYGVQPTVEYAIAGTSVVLSTISSLVLLARTDHAESGTCVNCEGLRQTRSRFTVKLCRLCNKSAPER